MEINLEVLESIFSLRKITHLKSLISSISRQHFLTQKELISTSKRDILNLANRLNERRMALNRTETSLAEKWMWREQKLFIWVIIYYAEATHTEVNAFSQQQFQKIIDLFPSKKQSFLNYEYTSAFLSDSESSSYWTPSDISLLQRAYEECGNVGDNRWKSISYRMFILSSETAFKPAQSCRNRWENHSNPILKKTPWTMEEDIKMANFIMLNGPRWAAVAKDTCNGRTEHMIKNRFRCLIKKLKINQKLSYRLICQTIIQKATSIHSSQIKKEEDLGVTTEENSTKLDAEALALQDLIKEEGAELLYYNGSFQQEGNEGLSAAEIIREVNLKQFGENHKYMTSLDDSWLDRIMDSYSSNDDIFDIYCN